MRFGRFVLLAAIPLDLVMIFWAWFGRIFFDVAGWGLFVFAIIASFAVMLLMVPGWVLAFRWAGPGGGLPPVAVWAKVVSWASLLVLGFTFVDQLEPQREASALTSIFGGQYLELSRALMIVSGAAFVVSSLVFIVRLLRGGRSRPPKYQNFTPVQRPPSGPWGPAPGAATHEPWGPPQAPIPPGGPVEDPWAPPESR